MAVDRALAGVRWPNKSLAKEWSEYKDLGATEPWIAQAVSSLLVASGHNTVLETGGYMGTTSAWLALALESMGGGTLTVVELEAERAQSITDRLESLKLKDTQCNVLNANILHVIPSLEDRSIGVAWIDDCHEYPHVETEIVHLWRKMRPGGLMIFHDVSSDGVCGLGKLVRKYGGIALDLPRLGPDGGLGIIQVP